MNQTTAQRQGQAKADPLPAAGILQRKCACGSHTVGGGDCTGCGGKEQSLQRKAISVNSPPLAIQRKLIIGTSDDPLEKEADRIAEEVMSMPANPAINRAPLRIQRFTGSPTGAITEAPPSVERVLSSPGRPLEPELWRDMERRFGYDFSQVRIHTALEAEQSARDVNSNAYTLGNNVAFGAGQFAPETHEGRRLMAHELVHVVQQTGGASRDATLKTGILNRGAVQGESDVTYSNITQRLSQPTYLQRQPTSLQGIPESERRALQITRTSHVIPNERIHSFFNYPARERHQLGSDTQVIFGNNIPDTLQTGLTSTAWELVSRTRILYLNSTAEINLDLTSHGGTNATFRFTYYEHRTGSGRSGTQGNVMLIEQIGESLSQPSQTTPPTGQFAVGSARFTLGPNWTEAEYSVLREALSLLSPTALTAANGLTFRQRSQPVEGDECDPDPDEVETRPGCGCYNSSNDAVIIYDCALRNSSLRFGQHSWAVYAVLHEIGHGLDRRPIYAAARAFDAAGRSRAARRTYRRARSLSGYRWEQDTDVLSQAIHAEDTDFRRAVRRDGVRRETGERRTREGETALLSGGITSYSEGNYEELFAESFALFVSAPETLRLLRPNTFQYFDSLYGRP